MVTLRCSGECGLKVKARTYATPDKTVWQSFPEGWLFWIRNGVLIVACSSHCAKVYINKIGC